MGNLLSWVRSLEARAFDGTCGLLALVAAGISSPVSAREIRSALPAVNVAATPESSDGITYQPEEVDLALVLAIDISSSISAEEHRLQRDGYARAFRDRAILDAIAGGGDAAIAVTVLEWANTRAPMQSIGWTLIDDAKSAEAFAETIGALPYHPIPGTSIGSAVAFAHMLLDDLPYRPLRRVIDVSGDGSSMRKPHLARARQAALDAGITINGLPIRDDPSDDLPSYYSQWVIGGPGAFVVVAEGFASFDTAVRQKLVLEIAGTTPAVAVRLARN